MTPAQKLGYKVQNRSGGLMSEEIKMSDILLRAVEVVISRDGDTDTEDGDFACVDIDSIIHLEDELSKLFSLDSDDVTTSDIPLIKTKAEKYDCLVEENLKLQADYESLSKQGKQWCNEYKKGIDTNKKLREENKRLREALQECIDELVQWQLDYDDFESEDFIASKKLMLSGDLFED